MSAARVRRVRCVSCGNAVTLDELVDKNAHAADRRCVTCAAAPPPPTDEPVAAAAVSKNIVRRGGAAAPTAAPITAAAALAPTGLFAGVSDTPTNAALRKAFGVKNQCDVVLQGDKGYTAAAYQYATSSVAADHASIPPNLAPLAIIYPKPPAANADVYVAKAIEWAAANGFAVAVRTGGHSYGGSSSGDSGCIQIDLSEGYAEYSWDNDAGIFTAGVSLNLGEFIKALAKCDTGHDANGVPLHFPTGCVLPTGQCSWVHLGGHVQTGGLGSLIRNFGALDDHVAELTVWTCGADKKAAKVTTHPGDELFKAMTGAGFGGSYGIAVQVKFRPVRASDHPYTRAGRMMLPYTKGTDRDVIEQLLFLVDDMQNAPGDYDLGITMTGVEDAYSRNLLLPSVADFDAKYSTPGLRNIIRRAYEGAGQALIVFFQYGNRDGRPDTYNPVYWERVMKILRPMEARVAKSKELSYLAQTAGMLLPNVSPDVITPLADCAQLWVYSGKREANYPFLKCLQNSDKVVNPAKVFPQIAKLADDFAVAPIPSPYLFKPDTMAQLTEVLKLVLAGKELEAIVVAFQAFFALVRNLMTDSKPATRCSVFIQFQSVGGAEAYARLHGNSNGTGLSWQKTATGIDMGIFYNEVGQPGAQKDAETFHQRALALLTSKDFAVADHRSVAFPHDFTTIEEQHALYIEPEIYAFATDFKKRIDPCNVFTCGPYSIGWTAVRGFAAAPASAKRFAMPAGGDAALTEGEDVEGAKRLRLRGLLPDKKQIRSTKHA